MTDWNKKLEKAKSLYESGLLDEEQYRAIQSSAVENLSTNDDKSTMLFEEDKGQIGAYSILNQIGAGGMGQVFRCRHRNAVIAERQGGDVAIKRLHPQYAKDPAFLARFDREATLGLKLAHPGIINVLDLIQDAGELAIVMEYIRGRPLTTILKEHKEPISLNEAWPLFVQVLDAVEYAHAQGVVHRDLKPENIIVDSDGVAKILDFGISKEVNQNQTKSGIGMGTVAYMAPEQYLDAKRTDQRADLYALGITLYEVLSGQLPWVRNTSDFEVLTLKKEGRLIPLREVLSNIGDELSFVIERATAPERDLRFESVSVFREALEACVTNPHSTNPFVVFGSTQAEFNHSPPSETTFEERSYVPTEAHITPPPASPKPSSQSNKWMFVAFGSLFLVSIGLGVYVNGQSKNNDSSSPSTPVSVRPQTIPNVAETAATPPTDAVQPEKAVQQPWSFSCDVEALSTLNAKTLRLQKEEVYARHGKTFKSKALKRHFSKQSWYEPFDGYSSRLLTDEDRQCLDRIRELEENAGGKKRKKSNRNKADSTKQTTPPANTSKTQVNDKKEDLKPREKVRKAGQDFFQKKKKERQELMKSLRNNRRKDQQ